MANTKTRKAPAKKTAAKEAPKPTFDLHQTVTDKIVAALETGVAPWRKSWDLATGSGAPVLIRPLRHNGEPYRGLNVLLLWSAAEAAGFKSPYWMTFKQALEYGGNVKKGEKSTMVTYASRFTKKGQNGKEDKSIFIWKWYAVFNVEQCENLPEKFAVVVEPVLSPEEVQARTLERVSHADDYFGAVGAKINHKGNNAYYNRVGDYIQMPLFDQFHNTEAYYATLGHEHIHWSGHSSRCNREFGKRFGDEAYAFEELVAELGAAFLCADLGLSAEPREDHASYLDHWLKVLRQDKRAIFTAASLAQRACEHLHAAADERLLGEVEPDEVDVVEAGEPAALAMAA